MSMRRNGKTDLYGMMQGLQCVPLPGQAYRAVNFFNECQVTV
jgi:hypothetical protein